MSKIYVVICILLLIHLIGCVRHDKVLSGIYDFVSEYPDSALAALDSIDYRELSTSDRHFYDLLRIKATDKAFIRPTSDSLILDVIEYYKDHRSGGEFTEALYYGGRVYSDLGDYPSAVKYFTSALELLPHDTSDLKLRGNVLGQLSSVCNSLRLYDLATDYINQAIEVDRRLNDTINEIYDLQLAGAICLHTEKYDKAEMYFTEVLEKSKNTNIRNKATSLTYLAAVKYNKNCNDSALILIREAIQLIQPQDLSTAISYAAGIYRKAGIIDTAYLYAKQLISGKYTSNSRMGYHILLSSELRQMSPADTLIQYVVDYSTMLENRFDENMNDRVNYQFSTLNYKHYQSEGEKLANSNKTLWRWLYGIVLIVLLLLVLSLWLNIRKKEKEIELKYALERIDKLESAAKNHDDLVDSDEMPVDDPSTDGDSSSDDIDSDTHEDIHARMSDDYDSLRASIRSELLTAADNMKKRISIPHELLVSETVAYIKKCVEEDKPIDDRDSVWSLLEAEMLKHYPKFKERMLLLSGGRLTRANLNTAMLVKCGITPTEMCKLFGRTKGTIESRRSSLGERLFGERLSIVIVDAAVRAM